MPRSYKNQPSVNRFNFIRWYQDLNLIKNGEFAVGSGNNFTNWSKTIPTHTNILKYSDDLTNAVWSKTDLTATTNSITGSVGNAFKHIFYQLPGGLSGSYTYQFKAKYDTQQFIQVLWSGEGHYTNIDLVNGVVASFSGESSTIEPIGGGYFLIKITFNATVTDGHFISLIDSLASARASNTTSTNKVFIKNQMLEPGNKASSYIPTTSSSVTADDGEIIPATRSNLLLYANDFTNVVWSKINSAIIGNKLVEDVGVSQKYILQSYSTSSFAPFTYSESIKADGRNYVRFGMTDGISDAYVDVNLINGTTNNITALGSWLNPVAVVKKDKDNDGYWRISFTCTKGDGTNIYPIIYICNTLGNTSYNGDGTSGILLKNAQLEPSSIDTEFIPTTFLSVTVNDGVSNSRAIRINRGVKDTIGFNQSTVLGSAGKYKVEFWAKKATQINPIITLKSDSSNFQSFEINSTSFQKYEAELNALLADNQISITSDVDNSSVIIDNVVIKEIKTGENVNIPNPYKINPGMYSMPILTPGDILRFYINFDTPITGITKSDIIPALYTANGERVYSWSTSVLSEITVGAGKHYYTNDIDLSVLNSLSEGIYYLALYNTATGNILYTSNYLWLLKGTSSYDLSSYIEFRHYKNIFNFQYEHNDLTSYMQKFRIMLLEKEILNGGEVSTYREISTGKTRLTNSYDERVVKAETYYFDREMHEAADVLFRHENITINDKSYIAKGFYSSNLEQVNALSKGEIELIDQEFSELNK